MDLLKNLDNMITAKLILTGKETYDSEYPTVSKHDALEAMIEFAKLHVEEALKQASENALLGNTEKGVYSVLAVSKDSILKSYPLENIR